MFVFFFSCITLHRLSACGTLWSVCQRFLIFRCLAGDLETSICVWMQLPFLCIGIVISINLNFFSLCLRFVIKIQAVSRATKRLKLHISVFSIDQLPFLRSTSIKCIKLSCYCIICFPAFHIQIISRNFFPDIIHSARYDCPKMLSAICRHPDRLAFVIVCESITDSFGIGSLSQMIFRIVPIFKPRSINTSHLGQTSFFVV